MIKSRYLLFSFLISLSNSLVADPTDNEKLLTAIKSGHQANVIKHIETREQTQQSKISALLSDVEKGLSEAETVAGDAGKAATVVSTIASATGNPSVAAAAGEVAVAANYIEPILEAVTSGNKQNEDSALLQAAQEAEQIALSTSGIKSRLLAAFVAAGCFTFMGVKIWADVFSTDNDTADKRAAALTTDAGVLATAGSLGLGGLYYAITNKYNNDAQTQAKMVKRVVNAHVTQNTPGSAPAQ